MDKVPYMQRGGAWDDSDLTKKGEEMMAKRTDKMIRTSVTSKKIVPKKWTKTDEAYSKVRFACFHPSWRLGQAFKPTWYKLRVLSRVLVTK